MDLIESLLSEPDFSQDPSNIDVDFQTCLRKNSGNVSKEDHQLVPLRTREEYRYDRSEELQMDKYSDTFVSDVGRQDDSLASDSTESEELSEGMEYSGEEVYQDPGELISDVQDGMYDNIGTDTVEDQTFADYRESESDEDLGENDESDNSC